MTYYLNYGKKGCENVATMQFPSFSSMEEFGRWWTEGPGNWVLYHVVTNEVTGASQRLDTFQDAMLAWRSGYLAACYVPEFIDSRDDARVAYEAGILDEDEFCFFDTMQYDPD